MYNPNIFLQKFEVFLKSKFLPSYSFVLSKIFSNKSNTFLLYGFDFFLITIAILFTYPAPKCASFFNVFISKKIMKNFKYQL